MVRRESDASFDGPVGSGRRAAPSVEDILRGFVLNVPPCTAGAISRAEAAADEETGVDGAFPGAPGKRSHRNNALRAGVKPGLAASAAASQPSLPAPMTIAFRPAVVDFLCSPSGAR